MMFQKNEKNLYKCKKINDEWLEIIRLRDYEIIRLRDYELLD
jgi:hypothetical protein